MKLFFSVGEPSGDLHGANLISRLRERHFNLECIGFGGPKMANAGLRQDVDLTKHAIMGFLRVLPQLRKFYNLLRQADEILRTERPDAVVLIDFPGFNWWIARRAKAHGIPVFYYGIPQIWAWAPWRVRKMRRLIDYPLCKLPFEVNWLRRRGCSAAYVGHPFFDEMKQQRFDQTFLHLQSRDRRPLVTLLPGSRGHEVADNLPWLLSAAEKVHQKTPHVRFAIAAFNERLAEKAREQVATCAAPVEVHVGRTPELMHLAHCCMACSGSVSLELMHHRKPTVIVYRLTRMSSLAMWLFVRVKYITLVNLLAADDPFGERHVSLDPKSPQVERLPFPEYPTRHDKTDQFAAHVTQWLQDPLEHARRVRQLDELCRLYGHAGASSRAADFILDKLLARQSPLAKRSAA